MFIISTLRVWRPVATWMSLASNYNLLGGRLYLKRKKCGDGDMPQQLRRHSLISKDNGRPHGPWGMGVG